MRAYDVECLAEKCDIHIYSDPEFAALLWWDVEGDDEASESDDVVRLSLKKNDRLFIEWLGMELVDGQVINCVEVTQPLAPKNSLARVKYVGWIPSWRLPLREGTQKELGVRILSSKSPTC